MIEEFIDSALLIDDNEAEVGDLILMFNQMDIYTSYYTPDTIFEGTIKKNRKIIFLDLSLDDSRTIVENIAFIRRILTEKIGNGFGNYGIVLWTKHLHHIDTLIEKIQQDRKKSLYTIPLFIVGLDKYRYIKAGNFDTLFYDLNEELKHNPAAVFFIDWYTSVNKAKDKTISSIYSLVPNYSKQQKDILFILNKLAINYTGINQKKTGNYPLHQDAYKAFDEILYSQLIESQLETYNIFDGIESFDPEDNSTKFKDYIYSSLNSTLLIDITNIDQKTVIPGNIYEIIDADSPFSINDDCPQGSTKILIEITPPCDFSNGKNINSRVVGGFLIDYTKKIKGDYNKDYHYKELYPLQLNDGEPKIIIFDFRYSGIIKEEDLIDPSKYKVHYRAKPKLFADILQKYSSNSARLGLAAFH